MRRAFTLIEVNLAMLVMAVGVLSIVGLYAHGYRESAQSREDVEAAALADHVISPLVMAISSTNLVWKDKFSKEFHFPDRTGWGAYFDSNGELKSNPDDIAQKAFTDTMAFLRDCGLNSGDKDKVDTSFPLPGRSETGGGGAARTLMCGLVVLHDKGSSVVRIGFRATPRPGMLLSMPIFYTEARFQGDPNK